ncbi:hypothetical protein [Mesorhizobium sp. B1-1-5]|uniref:hypothetical protein n=1 Tax=Mesorhizobium sp. B1-1-5 TaxID=2589979 RepID=UPI00112DF0D6|nr:hypothetical protein [Mesorhizobium sp. B1-1-5]TPO13732.1 hypothetical protein FJ980_00715 [Mesorhizobium sp. B1-1-5]
MNEAIQPTPHAHHAPQQWEKVAIFAFGVVFIAIMLAIAIWMPEPAPFPRLVFGLVCSLCAGAIATLIPGQFGLSLPLGVRAVGGIAVFGFVFMAFQNLAGGPIPDHKGRFPKGIDTGWIFAGYIDAASGKYKGDHYAAPVNSSVSDPVFEKGDKINVLANRELIIKDYKSASAQPFASPTTIPGGVLRQVDRTSISIEKGTNWVVMDVVRAGFVGNDQMATWLRIGEIP